MVYLTATLTASSMNPRPSIPYITKIFEFDYSKERDVRCDTDFRNRSET